MPDWGKLPAFTNGWGEVGVSLTFANRAALLAQNDPTMQRRIRRNSLMDQIDMHQKEALRLQREAKHDQTRAAGILKDADKKLLCANKMRGAHDKAVSELSGASRENNAKDIQQTRILNKKTRLESQAKLLQKQAATLLEEADKLYAKSLKSSNKEETARFELAQLEPNTDDQTWALENSDFGEFDGMS